MSTRATIRFKAGKEEYFVYRHCDGFPEDVMPDISRAIKCFTGRAHGHCIEQLIAIFFGLVFDQNQRLQRYEPTTAFHGDESYRYEVSWDGSMWQVKVEE